jgi:hypothetical protein
MLSRILHVLTAMALLAPYALGIVFIWFPIRRVYFDPFLERAIYFVLLFSCWQLFLWVAFRWFLPSAAATLPDAAQRPDSPKTSSQAPSPLKKRLLTLLRYAALIGSASGSLALLQFFKARLPLEHFYLALFALGTLALTRSLTERNNLSGSLLALFVSCLAIGYLSFLIVDPFWKWEPLFPCAGVGAMFVARGLALRFSQGAAPGEALPLRIYRLRARLLMLFFLLAPTLVTSLCYLGKLSHNFVFIFGIFPLLLPLAEALRAGEQTGLPPSTLGRRSQVIFLTYIAILFGIGLMGRFS